jgi:SET domain-containing protein
MSMTTLSFLSPKTAVRPSPIHGKGLFAIAPIADSEVVCVKGGHNFNRSDLCSISEKLGPAEIQLADDLFIGPITEEERDGSMVSGNHSCDPNIGVQGQIVVVAMRDIAAGEELTHDWTMTDNDSYEMECHCDTANCRQVITGQD